MLKRKMYNLLYKDRLVRNYFRTNHKKNVLISYISRPFILGPDHYHVNSIDSIEIAKIFDSLGYNVDVINYDSNRNLDYKKYDLIFGFGEPLINSFYDRKKDIVTIYYGTGMHVEYQNRETLERIIDLYNRKRVWVPESGRVVEKTWSVQTSLVDAMVVKGGDFTAKSYKDRYDGIVKSVQARYNEVCDYKDVIANKDFNKARKNFLWFGSCGAVHKGLDLLLEVFSNRNDINLYVCSNIKAEKRFCEIYNKELFLTENIHVCGFVSVQSKQFFDLLEKCAFTILPSCSEGQATSVLTVSGNGGLIPLVTKQTGCEGKAIIDIEAMSFEAIEKSIDKAISMSVDEIKIGSLEIGKNIAKVNSMESFCSGFKFAIEGVLSELECA